jgi:hypothetical protein
MAFRIKAKRCLCASVTAALLYGRNSSVPKPILNGREIKFNVLKNHTKNFHLGII